MTIEVERTGDGAARIRVRGVFDFSLHEAFRAALERMNGATSCVVDLSGVEALDSSALGMLLVLRDRLGGDAARVRITGAAPGIRRILEISRFDKLFTLD